MYSFVLLAYASLAASRTLLQQLLACLNFTLDSEDWLCGANEKSDFCELWQQHKQQKTMEVSEAWLDTHNEWYIPINSNLNPLTKFTNSSKSTEFKNILPWNISEMIIKTVWISTTIIVISYAMKQGIPLWVWWKVNGNWDNNMIRVSQTRGSHCRANASIRRNK